MASDDVPQICRMLRQKYSNVDITPRIGPDGKLYLMIEVHHFLFGGKMKYKIKTNGKSIRSPKPKDSLEWIDRMEELDAFMDNF